YNQHTTVGAIIPSPDGKYLYTGSGGVYTQETKSVIDRDKEGGSTIPAVQGDYYLRYNYKSMGLHRAGESRQLLDLTYVQGDIMPKLGVGGGIKKKDKFKGGGPGGPGGPGAVTSEKRLLFVPDANLLVALTPDCEKIHVFPIDIESALDKAGVDY